MSISNAAANSLMKQVIAKDAKAAAHALEKQAERKGSSVEHSSKAAMGRDSLTLTAKAVPAKGTAKGAATAGTMVLAAPKGPLPKPKASGEILDVSFNDAYLESKALNEPLSHASAKNTDKYLFQLIDRAKTRLDGAFYDIEDLTVTTKLIAAKKRGVDVRLVTDSDNLVDKLDPTKPREAIQRLKAAGIKVVADERSAIMHHKFMVVDGAKVWAGSTNLTPTSLYMHNNNTLTLKSKELANTFTEEFNRLFEKREFGSSTRPDLPPNPPVQLKDAEVQVFFSPNGGGRQAVLDELAGANKRISFMTFSLTDPEIGQTMLQKAQDGVKVQGIFDRWLAAGEYSLYETFHKRGLPVLKDGNEALMHHKVMVIDDRTVITGSFNFSNNAEHNNNEAMFIIRNAPHVVKDYAAEFERLKHAALNNHPPAVKRPDAEINTEVEVKTAS